MKERVIRRLMASIKCSSCEQQYEEYDIDVLGHNEDMWFLRVRCSSCHTESLVAAVIREDKMPEVVTDLAEAEVNKFINMDVVGADDVLDIHNFLKNFDGDFYRLFGQE